ncbi:MAG TPA: hypothetical protein VLF89_05110 [Candidatus Saccharimonadales bacterium]|nr:hypothetical protein [Candidatus Saccharimonadales bacterium]
MRGGGALALFAIVCLLILSVLVGSVVLQLSGVYSTHSSYTSPSQNPGPGPGPLNGFKIYTTSDIVPQPDDGHVSISGNAQISWDGQPNSAKNVNLSTGGVVTFSIHVPTTGKYTIQVNGVTNPGPSEGKPSGTVQVSVNNAPPVTETIMADPLHPDPSDLTVQLQAEQVNTIQLSNQSGSCDQACSYIISISVFGS